MNQPNNRGKEVHRFGKKNPLVGTLVGRTTRKNRGTPERTIAARILQRCNVRVCGQCGAVRIRISCLVRRWSPASGSRHKINAKVQWSAPFCVVMLRDF